MEHANWDEQAYKELNTYFKIKIELMLQKNPELTANSLELEELVAQFNEEDQERWAEFLKLDKQKMEIDMWNHLNGNGTRFQPGIGFVNPDDDTTW